MVLVPARPQDVVLPVFGATTVLLLHAGLLTTTHFRWLHIHDNVHRGHDVLCGCLLMRGTKRTPMHLGAVVIEDKGHPFTIGRARTLLPRCSNVTWSATQQPCVRFVGTDVGQVAHVGCFEPECHTACAA